jgi:nuclear pore complex protein Nup155
LEIINTCNTRKVCNSTIAWDLVLKSLLSGAIELPLYCAQIEDSDEQGRSWWLDGSPVGDPRLQAWERRRRCYDLVLDSLRVFDESTAGSSTSNGQAIRNAAYELALQADDEVFHSVFYDWLVERGLTDELLDVIMHLSIFGFIMLIRL